MLLDEAHNILIDILCLRAYFVVQVRTVERTLKLSRINNTQTLLDIRTYLIRCCCSQSNNRCHTNLVDDRTDTTVFRTEVMSPFRDTVSLVNCIERDLHRFQKLHVILLRQRLRSHIEQLRPSLADILLHLVNRRLVQRRVQKVCRSLMLTEVRDKVHLVLHQGYQW